MYARKSAVAVLAAASSAALVACGGGDDDNGVAEMSAEEILEEAKNAASEAETASISGNVVDDEGMEITLEFQFADGGTVGTLGADGAEFEVLNIDGTMYLKGSADSWDQIAGNGVGQLVADKYVLIPEEQKDSFGEFATFVELGSFVDEMLTAEGEVTVGEETEVNDTKVIGLENEGSTLYVATVGEPVPVRIEAPDGEEGSLDFEWGVDVDVEAPPEDQVIDLSALGGG